MLWLARGNNPRTPRTTSSHITGRSLEAGPPSGPTYRFSTWCVHRSLF